MMQYKLLKPIEEDTLPIGTIIEIWDVCNLDEDWTIPTKWLCEQWYLEMVDILVPDNISFISNSSLQLWLKIWKEWQFLFYNRGCWQVWGEEWIWRPIKKCKLEKKKLSDVKVWDFVVNIYWSIDDEKSYVLVTKVHNDWYEWMFFDNRALCYMHISALSDDPYVVVPLDNY